MNEIHISLIAVGLAAVSLGWNIYRDLISKSARVKVTGRISQIVAAGQKFGPEGPPKQIVISVVNHGPGDTTLSVFELRIKKNPCLFGKQQFATVLPDWKNPMSAQLPYELKVGQQTQFIFPFDSGSFLKLDLSGIGISDVFNKKTYRIKTRHVKELRYRWCEEFQKGEASQPR